MQYATPITEADAAAWGDSRETHAAVAMAIHAISDRARSPQEIWEAPTPAEVDHVAMAVENYVNNGLFEAAQDGEYQWGVETIKVSAAE